MAKLLSFHSNIWRMMFTFFQNRTLLTYTCYNNDRNDDDHYNEDDEGEFIWCVNK